jgi:diguanylate cyclase (GGDEF)-like protein
MVGDAGATDDIRGEMDGASDRHVHGCGATGAATRPGPGGFSLHDDGAGAAEAMIGRTLLRVCEQLTTTLGVWECSVYEFVPERDCLVTQATWSRALGADDVAFVGADTTINRHPGVRRVFGHGGVAVVQADEEQAGSPDYERMRHWGEKTALYTRLELGGETLGLLELIERRERHEFGPEDVRLVTALAEVAALAIANARVSQQQLVANRRLNALLGSSRALSSTVVLEEVLQRLAEEAARALDAPSCYIYEYDETGDCILWRSEFHADPGHRDPDPPGTVYDLDDYPWDREVLQSGRMRLYSVGDASLPPAQAASMRAWDELSMLTVPLRFGDETVGLMEIAESRPERSFDTDEIELARALGEQAAAAIRNAKWFRRESWRNERLVKVLEISHRVSASLNADDIVSSVGSRVGALFPRRETKVSVVCLDAAREPTSDADPADELVRLALTELHATEGAGAVGRRLVLPLATKSEAQGWMDICSPDARAFERDEVELLQLLANQVAAALDNTRLYAELARQAITDGLTGLFNHRYFYERLRDEVVRARRYGLPLSLLMLDLDDFKRYNDSYGHPAGDRVLRRVAQIMRAELRHSVDVAARYGGEEFAVILPHTDRGGAERVGRRLSDHVRVADADVATPGGAAVAGERVRHCVEAEAFPGRAPDEPAHITVSVGIASLPAHADDAEGLVMAADQALYLAKQHGKNRVETVT